MSLSSWKLIQALVWGSEHLQNVLCLFISDIYIESTTPPPGTYDIGGLNAFGRYTLCKHPGSGAAVFSPTGHDQLVLREKRMPGPGTYNPPGDIKDSNPHIPS